MSLSCFACTTLWLQYKRKKKPSDPTLWFWRIAMIFLLLSIAVWLSAQIFTQVVEFSTYPFVLGVLIIIGFILSLINGMLYKIIPFLVWLHLSILVGKNKVSRRLIPNIKTMISLPMAYIQLVLHVLTIALLLGWLFGDPLLFEAAAISFAASNSLLLVNLSRVLIIYKRKRSDILIAASD